MCARTAYRLSFASGALLDIAQSATYPLYIQHHLFAHQGKAGHSQGVHTHTYALRWVFLAGFCLSPPEIRLRALYARRALLPMSSRRIAASRLLAPAPPRALAAVWPSDPPLYASLRQCSVISPYEGTLHLQTVYSRAGARAPLCRCMTAVCSGPPGLLDALHCQTVMRIPVNMHLRECRVFSTRNCRGEPILRT